MSTTKSLHDRIFATADVPAETITVPQWDAKIEVRGMTARERAAMTQKFADAEGKIDYAALYPDLVIGFVYDPDTGEQVFTEDDRDALLSKSGAALDLIGATVMRLSGLGADDKDNLGKPSS